MVGGEHGLAQKPQTGDYIRVSPGTFPGYPFCVFAVTGCVDADIYQICIRPAWEKDLTKTIWVHYQPDIHIVINKRQKEILDVLYE